MKEIAITVTRIILVFANGGEREYTYTEAFASTCLAWQYANSAKAYKNAYAAALNELGADEVVKWYFPLDSRFQTLVLQSEI